MRQIMGQAETKREEMKELVAAALWMPQIAQVHSGDWPFICVAIGSTLFMGLLSLPPYHRG